MTTVDIINLIASKVPNNISCIVSLGRTSEEAYKVFADQSLFLDSMGDVSSVAIGTALGLGRKYPVLALDTDGSALMSLALLPTLANLIDQVPNLMIVLLDNKLYESGGGLSSRYINLNWNMLGQSMGIDITVAQDLFQLEILLNSAFTKFMFIVADVTNVEPIPPTQKTMDGIESKYKFCRHLEAITNRRLLVPAIKS